MERRLFRVRAHLRQHDQHPRGRHPRGGLPGGVDHGGQQVRQGQEAAQGEGRQPHRRRHPRGVGRGHLREGVRAAVRGPDQDQARQHRGEVVRAEDLQRTAQPLVRSQPCRSENRCEQGGLVGTGANRRAQGPGTGAPQERDRHWRPARQAGRLPVHRSAEVGAVRRRGRFGGWFGQERSRLDVPGDTSRCAARSSTSRRPASIGC